MKFFKLSVFLIGFLTGFNAVAQQTLPTDTVAATINKTAGKKVKKNTGKDGTTPLISITLGAGTSNYYGDLIKNNAFFKQTSFSISAGLTYELMPNLNGRLDIGFQKLQGADSKEGGAHKSRNLSFKSNVFDISTSLEFTFFNMNNFKFSPYLTGGIGVLIFNPYAYDISGKKTFLRELGTEGQGLGGGYPAFYNKAAYEFPLGIGFKYAVSKRILLQLEYNFRITGTDYLDDVSNNGYIEKAVLDARNHLTSAFTYRGHEVPGGEPYPTNLKLPRGNPTNRDNFYTAQLKIAYAVKMKTPKVKTEITAPALEPTPKDVDGDGILDAFDRCPDIPGITWLQGCPDKDGDGIPDIDDKCPDEKGVARFRGCPVPDTDGDGVNDEHDKCPDVAGMARYQGCPVPDTDGDGLNDEEDICPYIKGSAEKNGCPIAVVEGAELINTTNDSMTYRIYFDFEKANLLPDAFNILRRIVDVLKADNSLFVHIAGHADTLGTNEINMRLSAERAYVSRDYFLSYYINKNRITTSSHGAKWPVNNVQQWLNRRVEITLYRKK